MAGTNLSFPFDAEIFNYSWKNTPDLILTTMLESGAVVADGEIAKLIANGSNFFTTPYYDVLAGTEDVYNGVSNFTGAGLTGGVYAGCVYGRMSKWSIKSFIKDFNSGADPMAQIVSGVANFWIKARQTRMISILQGIFGITGDADWDLHKTDISHDGYAQSEIFTVLTSGSATGSLTVTVTSAGMTGSPKVVTVAVLNTDTTVESIAAKIRTALTNDANVGAKFDVSGATGTVILTAKVIAAFDSTLAMVFAAGTSGATASASTDNTVHTTTVVDANKIGVTSINDACVKANGDNAGEYSLAIMHSVVANRLANLQLLEYSKYTDAAGITRNLPIGTINGKTVIVNDSVPTAVSPIEGQVEYTTYVLGNGCIRYAPAPVDVPSELDRDPNTNGGIDMIYTRIRECLTAYGFSFKGDVATDVGIPDAVLVASASYERKMPAKSIFMARLVTNG
jgi:hypothetical protein